MQVRLNWLIEPTLAILQLKLGIGIEQNLESSEWNRYLEIKVFDDEYFMSLHQFCRHSYFQ